MQRLTLVTFAVSSLLAISALTTSAGEDERAAVTNSSSGILVESIPSGASIKVNGTVYGRTPCKIPIARAANSNSGFIIITAFPATFHQYLQQRVFTEGEPIPSHLIFDMRLSPPNPALDVYYN